MGRVTTEESLRPQSLMLTFLGDQVLDLALEPARADGRRAA